MDASPGFEGLLPTPELLEYYKTRVGEERPMARLAVAGCQLAIRIFPNVKELLRSTDPLLLKSSYTQNIVRKPRCDFRS